MGTIPGGYALSINEYADFMDGMDDESKEAIGFTGLSRGANANSILQAFNAVSAYPEDYGLRQQLLSDANITENDINIFRQSSYELMQQDQETVRMNKKIGLETCMTIMDSEYLTLQPILKYHIILDKKIN